MPIQLPSEKTEELLHYFAISYEDRERLKKLYKAAPPRLKQMTDKAVRDLYKAWYEIRVMEEIYENRILAPMVDNPQGLNNEKEARERVERIMSGEFQPPKSDLVDRILFMLRRMLEP